MEIKVFKPGDKVILTDQGTPIGWEIEDYSGPDYVNLIIGEEYTVDEYINDSEPSVRIKEVAIKAEFGMYDIHPNHFTLKEDIC